MKTHPISFGAKLTFKLEDLAPWVRQQALATVMKDTSAGDSVTISFSADGQDKKMQSLSVTSPHAANLDRVKNELIRVFRLSEVETRRCFSIIA